MKHCTINVLERPDRALFSWEDVDDNAQEVEIMFSKETGLEIRSNTGGLIITPRVTNVINVNTK